MYVYRLCYTISSSFSIFRSTFSFSLLISIFLYFKKNMTEIKWKKICVKVSKFSSGLLCSYSEDHGLWDLGWTNRRWALYGRGGLNTETHGDSDSMSLQSHFLPLIEKWFDFVSLFCQMENDEKWWKMVKNGGKWKLEIRNVKTFIPIVFRLLRYLALINFVLITSYRD